MLWFVICLFSNVLKGYSKWYLISLIKNIYISKWMFTPSLGKLWKFKNISAIELVFFHFQCSVTLKNRFILIFFYCTFRFFIGNGERAFITKKIYIFIYFSHYQLWQQGCVTWFYLEFVKWRQCDLTVCVHTHGSSTTTLKRQSRHYVLRRAKWLQENMLSFQKDSLAYVNKTWRGQINMTVIVSAGDCPWWNSLMQVVKWLL